MEILRKIDLFQKEINALRPMEDRMLECVRCFLCLCIAKPSKKVLIGV